MGSCATQLITTRIESDSLPKQPKCEGCSSFLKKSTKKLLFSSVRTGRIRRANQWSKSFLVLFFKKELLSCCADVSVSTRVGIRTQSIKASQGIPSGRQVSKFETPINISHASRALRGRCAQRIRCNRRHIGGRPLGLFPARGWTGPRENAGRAKRTAWSLHIVTIL